MNLWNGIIVHLSDVFEGKKHDMSIFRASKLLDKMEYFQNIYFNEHLYLYGDPAYQIGQFILSPYKSINNTAQMNLFNTCMTSYRICVEWGFGKVVQEWAFIDFYKNQKLMLQPVSQMYTVAVLLSNLRSCYYGNQTAAIFEIQV